MSHTASFIFDLEFNDEIGDCRIEPISIGIVAADDSSAYYGVSNEFNEVAAHPWLQENVIPKLPPMADRISLVQMRKEIIDFFREYAPPAGEEAKAQLWGKNPGGDQAVLGLIFGGLSHFYAEMNKLGFKRTFFNDTDTLRARLTENAIPVPRLNIPESERHTAIGDAQQERREYVMMQDLILKL